MDIKTTLRRVRESKAPKRAPRIHKEKPKYPEAPERGGSKKKAEEHCPRDNMQALPG